MANGTEELIMSLMNARDASARLAGRHAYRSRTMATAATNEDGSVDGNMLTAAGHQHGKRCFHNGVAFAYDRVSQELARSIVHLYDLEWLNSPLTDDEKALVVLHRQGALGGCGESP